MGPEPKDAGLPCPAGYAPHSEHSQCSWCVEAFGDGSDSWWLSLPEVHATFAVDDFEAEEARALACTYLDLPEENYRAGRKRKRKYSAPMPKDIAYEGRTPPVLGRTKMRLYRENEHTYKVFDRLAQIAKWARGSNCGKVYASQEELALIFDCDTDTIRRAYRRLEQLGLLRKWKGTGGNRIGKGERAVVTHWFIYGIGFPPDRRKRQD